MKTWRANWGLCGSGVELINSRFAKIGWLSLVLVLAFSQAAFARFPDNRPFGRPLVDGPARSLFGTRKIVLTFDDGPSEFTPQLLDVLKRHGAKATFFVMGNKMTRKNLPIIRRIVREGHILASHFWDHVPVGQLSEENFRIRYRTSIRLLAQLLREFGGNPHQLYFRFPYGNGAGFGGRTGAIMREVSMQLFGENCVQNVFWDITSYDWLPEQTSQTLYRSVQRKVLRRPGGGVILFHDAISKEELEHPHPGLRRPEQVVNTVHAVDLLLTNAKARGIRVVPLNTVAEYGFGRRACRLRE